LRNKKSVGLLFSSILLLSVLSLIVISWVYREEINDEIYDLNNRYVTKEELEEIKKEIIAKIPSINYIPFVVNNTQETPIPTPEPIEILNNSGIRNVMDFGAVPNDNIDDTGSIFSAISDLPETGGIVFFPPGEFIVTETIVLWKDGITLEGSGQGRLGYLWGTPRIFEGATKIKWDGEINGVLLKIGNGEIPNAGCSVKNIVLDGNEKASSLIIADATFYLNVDSLSGYGWQNGFGIIIKHSKGVVGAGEKFHIWNNITLVNPYEKGSGIDISPEGSLNINQITITGCNIKRSNDYSQATSLRLGYVDHISFFRCVFGPSISSHDWYLNDIQKPERKNPYAITVDPTSTHRSFPMNITFFGTSIYGGINYVDEHPWNDNNFYALLFYPFYSADWQKIPPYGYINGEEGMLPYNLVGGFTDQGIQLNP
jgi:hypothetical protein